LVFNYLGHVGEDGYHLKVWEKSDGQNLSNQYKPIYNYTCRFSPVLITLRDPQPVNTRISKGGAIAMITTIRSIGQFSAETSMMFYLKTVLLWLKPILLLLKRYEYQKTVIQIALQM
jgi:hypothetical protein